jgi:hypothetical protein
MDKTKILTAITVIGSICSFVGVSLLGMIGAIPDGSPIPPIALALIGLPLIAALIDVGVLRRKLMRALDQRDGRTVGATDRSQVSRSFTRGTLRTLRIFAGDLSWLEEDLSVYRALTKRGVSIRILTDTPTASAIPVAKPLGIEFRQYPNGTEALLKASISDAEDEVESRALVVKRRTFRPGSNHDSEYCYRMKEYHGCTDSAVIKAMMLLFDEKFVAGKQI